MNCPTCDEPMKEVGPTVTLVPGDQLHVAVEWFCAPCTLWHHHEPTDPDERDRIVNEAMTGKSQ
jgi:hypothetical protein